MRAFAAALFRRRGAPVAPTAALNYHGRTDASQGVIMSKDTDPPPADVMSALIEMRGLKRTYELYPEIVATAFERGRRPIGSFPEKFSAVTEPAGRFTALPGSDE